VTNTHVYKYQAQKTNASTQTLNTRVHNIQIKSSRKKLTQQNTSNMQ